MKVILGIVVLCLLGSLGGFWVGYSRESKVLDAQLASITDPQARQQAMLTLKRERSSVKRLQAIEKAITSDSYRAFRKLVRQDPWLSAGELERTLKMLAESDDADSLYRELLKRWAQVDAAAALEFARTELRDSNQYQGLHGIFDQMASKDPAHAFATWKETLSQLDDPMWAQGALLAIADAWWARDVDAAMGAIQTLEDESDRHSAINGCFGETFDKASDGEKLRLLTALKNLEEPGNRHHGLQAFANALTRDRSLREMEVWMEDQALTGEELAHVERGVAIKHLQKNPKKAAQWLGERATDESLSEHLTSIIVGGWSRREPNAAGEWLGTFPLSERTDAPTIAYANTVSHDDIESAFHWAQRIQNAEKRLDTLTRLAKRWSKKDPSSANAAVAQSNMSEAHKATLQEELRQD